MISDTKFELRAYGAMSVLIQSANAFQEAVLTSHPSFKELPPAKQGQILLLTMLTLLFDGQQFFWDQVLADKQAAERFERFFYTVFRDVTSVNPSKRLKDHRAHIELEGEAGRGTYLGQRINSDVMGGAEPDTVTAINELYAGLVKSYQRALGQIWDMPDEALAQAKTELTQLPS